MAPQQIRFLPAFLAVAVLVSACTNVRPPRVIDTPPVVVTPAVPAPLAVPQAAPQAAKPAAAVVQYTGKMSVTPANGPPGSEVTVRAEGMPANTEMHLVWNTVKGSWVLKGQYRDEFHGRDFQEVTSTLASATSDGAGNLQARFKVPEGFGFDHDVTLVEAKSGTIRNKANFSVDMQIRVSPTSGPPGTPIHIEAKGIGYRYMYNSWVLMYDNKLTGWLSSVTTDGTAHAVIPAAGRPGKHVIKVMHGWSSQAYLNPHQSAEPERPQFLFEFTITDGQAALPKPAEQQGLAPEAGSAPPGTGPALWTHPSSGPLDTPAEIHARGLPPGKTVDLVWYRMEGSRLEGWAIKERALPLGTAVVGADGHLKAAFKSPDDLGGFHRIEARLGDQVLAEGGFTITPKVFSIEPSSGPPGTTVRIHMKGVGWTETANIYHLNYDNAYIGYACGFKSLGDVEIFLQASGEPGWHFIDLYPGIYKGKDITGVINFRTPQLTAEADHPGERLPIFRLAFLVTP